MFSHYNYVCELKIYSRFPNTWYWLASVRHWCLPSVVNDQLLELQVAQLSRPLWNTWKMKVYSGGLFIMPDHNFQTETNSFCRTEVWPFDPDQTGKSEPNRLPVKEPIKAAFPSSSQWWASSPGLRRTERPFIVHTGTLDSVELDLSDTWTQNTGRH